MFVNVISAQKIEQNPTILKFWISYLILNFGYLPNYAESCLVIFSIQIISIDVDFQITVDHNEI